MPTTKTKNWLYQRMLPFLAPSCGRHPLIGQAGAPIHTRNSFERILRRHHVLGSATLLSLGEEEMLLFSASQKPRHIGTVDTYFRVASITKMATALVTLTLVDQGLLSLDVPVGHYFPQTREADALRGITLRHLLSHTAGIIDPPDLESALETGQPWSVLLEGARKSEPGEDFHYSNFGFGLVGCVLEAVCDQPVSQIFTERLFEPLHMRATLDASELSDEDIMPVTRVLPYHQGHDLLKTALGRRALIAPDPLRHYGHTAGSMYTDIRSLRVLCQCIQQEGKPLLHFSGGAEMTRPHAAYGALSPTLSYGLGLLIIQDPLLTPHRLLGHQGFAYGCADGAFWEESTGALMIHLNGGASEARTGRLGLLNDDLLAWALKEEFPQWN